VALEKLGYKVYHCSECATRWKDDHVVLFKEAMEAKLYGKGTMWTGADLDKVLQGYTVRGFSNLRTAHTDCVQAIEDIPCLHFVDELLEQYPNAKVILTTRDIDSWEQSVQNTIFKIVNLRIITFMVAIDPVSA
jgi:hypothetical protein